MNLPARRNGSKISRKRRVLISRASGFVARRQSLPDYLTQPEAEALIQAAPDGISRLIMLLEWRAGLRISEALAVQGRDIILDPDNPVIVVQQGKGSKSRAVPLHPELAAAFRMFFSFTAVTTGQLFGISRSTAHRRIKEALEKARALGQIPQDKDVHDHTLRHSAARHWLASGVPINVVSRWLGHASLQTTLIYLEILPDPTGYMDRVP